LLNGIQGFAYGLSGLVGGTSFWDPLGSNNSNYQNKMNDFSDAQNAWNNKIETDKDTLAISQKQFADDQTNLMSVVQDFKNQVMADSISQNSLFIIILFFMVI